MPMCDKPMGGPPSDLKSSNSSGSIQSSISGIERCPGADRVLGSLPPTARVCRRCRL